MPLTEQTALRKDLHTAPVQMQHRHFATIAAMVRELPERVNRLTVARSFADKLAHTNRNFDRARFIAACQGEEAN